jgi:hypothetical protein
MHLQVLLDDSQYDGRDAAFALSSQHSSSFFAGCFLLQCLQIGALLFILHLFLVLFFLPPFDISLLFVRGLFSGGLFSDFTNAIISFIASVVFLIKVSIWRVVAFCEICNEFFSCLCLFFHRICFVLFGSEFVLFIVSCVLCCNERLDVCPCF